MIDKIIAFSESRYARLVLVGLIFLSLQTTIFNEMRPFGVCLQVMVLLAASCGLARGSEAGAIAGFIVGLLYDMVLSSPLGLCAAVFAIVGYLAGFAHSFVHAPNWWSRMVLGFGASAVGMLMLPVAFTFTGSTSVFTTDVIIVAPVVALFNGLLSVPVERLCRWAIPEGVAVQ